MAARTIRDVLTDAKARFAPISTSASLDAQLLLAEVLGVSRAHVIAHPEKSLTPAQSQQIDDWVARRARGEPIAYILGRQAFYDRTFAVSSHVLIPRPETEHLLEMAIAYTQAHPRAVCVDVGTGSGALAVTLAAHAPSATVHAVDVSAGALAIARHNATTHAVTVQVHQGDLLLPLAQAGLTLDLVMANLPYIATETMHDLAVSQYEPHLALDGGADGLDLIRRLLAQVPQVCAADALILLEIGADQGQAVQHLAQQTLSPRAVYVVQDYAGLDRVVRIQR